MHILNDLYPWRGTLRGQMTIKELLGCRTLSLESAATLWWAIDQGASVFVTAGPPGAGKSTVANALLEFLPDDARVYVTSGGWDPIDLPTGPGPMYLLVNELSSHTPVYLYGEAARRAFAQLRTGIRMLGTLHARAVAEAAHVMCYEAQIAQTEIATPFVFAVISAGWSGGQIVRRVVELGLLGPGGELTMLTASGTQGLHLIPAGVEALARWRGLDAGLVQSAIADRARQLTSG